MLKNNPTYTPENILNWLLEGQEKEDIFQVLTDLRQKNYAEQIKVNSLAEIICHALTTHKPRHANEKKILRAIDELEKKRASVQNMPTGEIILLVLEVLKIILQLAQDSKCCTKKSTEEEVMELIKASNNNPFLNLANTKIRGNLQRAHIKYAALDFADLNSADLTGADLSRASCQHTDFTNVNLSKADLSHADLRNANLKNAKLDDTKLPELAVKTYLQTTWPKGLSSSETELQIVEKALQELHDLADQTRYVGNKAEIRAQEHRRNHEQRRIVAKNIVNISADIADLNARHYFLARIYTNPFFQDHQGAKFAEKLNSAVLHTAHLFGSHRKDPVLGSSSQEILRKAMRECSEQLHRDEKKIALRS